MMVQYASTTDSLTIKGVYWVDTVVTGTIYDGVANSITATLKDVDNDTVTTFDGDFTVTAQDDNGLIVQVSADGVTYTDSIDVTATSGAYTGDVYFDITDDIIMPIVVRFQVASADAINEYQPYGVDSVALGVPWFCVTTTSSSPIEGANGTTFGLTVTAKDGGGDTLTGYDGDASLNIVKVSDHTDYSIYSPSNLTITLNSGVGTIVAFAITKNIGIHDTDDTNVAIEADDGTLIGYKDLTALGWSTYNDDLYNVISGKRFAVQDIRAESEANFILARDAAYAALQIDNETDSVSLPYANITYDSVNGTDTRAFLEYFYYSVVIPETYRDSSATLKFEVIQYETATFVIGPVVFGFKAQLSEPTVGSDIEADGTFELTTTSNTTSDYTITSPITGGIGTQTVYALAGHAYSASSGGWPGAGVDAYATAKINKLILER